MRMRSGLSVSERMLSCPWVLVLGGALAAAATLQSPRLRCRLERALLSCDCREPLPSHTLMGKLPARLLQIGRGQWAL